MSRKDPDFFCFHHRGPSSFFIFMNLCYFDTPDCVHLYSDEKETLARCNLHLPCSCATRTDTGEGVQTLCIRRTSEFKWGQTAGTCSKLTCATLKKRREIAASHLCSPRAWRHQIFTAFTTSFKFFFQRLRSWETCKKSWEVGGGFFQTPPISPPF